MTRKEIATVSVMRAERALQMVRASGYMFQFAVMSKVQDMTRTDYIILGESATPETVAKFLEQLAAGLRAGEHVELIQPEE